MVRYVAHRVLQAVVVLFLVSVLLFLLLRILGGSNPCYTVSTSCGESAQATVPAADQYHAWLSGIVHGGPASAPILQRLPATILLIAVSYLLQQLLALSLGILAAVRQYSLFDQLFTLLSYVVLSVPAFVLALALIYLVPANLHVLAVGHTTAATLPHFWSASWFATLHRDPTYVLGDLVQHLVLPAVTLAVIGIAVDSRFMRASLLEVLAQEYIRTARAKGVPGRQVILKHALRNALLPIVTNVGMALPALLTSVIVVETVFTWDGVGSLFVTAIQAHDAATIETLVLLATVAVLAGNLAADLVYAWIDPRIRYG